MSEIILNATVVKDYIKNNEKMTKIYSQYLYEQLIQNMNAVNIDSELEKLSQELFKRLDSVHLLDTYEAYQELDNSWNYISQDLEIIHTEGIQSCTKVDPNMVIKKKSGKDIEIQDEFYHLILFKKRFLNN